MVAQRQGDVFSDGQLAEKLSALKNKSHAQPLGQFAQQQIAGAVEARALQGVLGVLRG